MRLTSDQAAELILRGDVRADLVVEGGLDFAHVGRPLRLPPRLTVAGALTLTGSAIVELPDGLSVWGSVRADRCPRLERVGRIRAGSLDVSDCRALRVIDERARIRERLIADRCVRLERLPGTPVRDRVSLRDCVRLRELPAGLRSEMLDLRGCSGLAGDARAADGARVDELTRVTCHVAQHRVDADTARHWIGVGRARTGLHVDESLDLRGSGYIDALPDPLIVNGDLSLSGCRVRRLPQRIDATGVLDLTGVAGLQDVPAGWIARETRLPDGRVQSGRNPRRVAGRPSALGLMWMMTRVVWSVAASGEPVPPRGLRAAEALDALRRGAPRVVVLGDLSLRDIRDLERLPDSLWVDGNLEFRNNVQLTALPEDLRVSGRLSVADCPRITSLPAGLSAGDVSIARCPALTALPTGLTCRTLALAECEAIERVPEDALVSHTLSVSRCPRFVELPAEIVLAEQLALAELPALRSLPTSIRVRDLRLRALPLLREIGAGVSFQTAELSELPALERLPAIEARHLTIRRAERLAALPSTLRVSESLSLGRLSLVTAIPEGPSPRHVECTDAPRLTALPAGWRGLRSLDLSRCPALTALPPRLAHITGNLALTGAASLRALPPELNVRGRLDLRGCGALAALPAGMPPPMAAEIGETALTGLPASWQMVQLTWRSVAVTAAMLFETARLTPAEILAEPNAELRAVLIERYGFARLLAASTPTLVDCDTDAGGPRELVSMPNGPGDLLVGLKVHCPSTGRLFYLRVPPWIRTCHGAAAWVAGFDNPDDYRPILET